MRPYDAIARRYDTHGWDWYAAANGDRLLTLLAESGVAPGAAILDAGCGTGTLALFLEGAGYKVTGVDLSPGMIEGARAKDRASRITWHVGDVTALDLGARFDAIVTVADVLNHLPRIDLWEAAFRSFHRHLAPGGLVVADVMTERGLSQMDQQLAQERGGVTLMLAIVWEPRERRSTLKVTSFAPSPSNPELYERSLETISEWAYPIEDVFRCARDAGFSPVERVWGLEADPEHDDRLTILARARTSTP
jgi:SAM-dependent methyltransferase